MIEQPLIVFLNTNGVIFLVLLVLGFLYSRKSDREVFWHAFFVTTVTLIVSVLLKELFARPRPFEVQMVEPDAGLALLSSFPSAHAGLAFAISTTVALHRRRLGIFLLVLSALIALGRVAASVHYPSDIAFGALIGVTVALFFDTMHAKRRKLRS